MNDLQLTICKLLETASAVYPDLRVGQIICNAIDTEYTSNHEVFYIEDVAMCEALRKYIRKSGKTIG